MQIDRVLLFDLDGTLVPGHHSVSRCTGSAFFDALGVTFGPDEMFWAGRGTTCRQNLYDVIERLDRPERAKDVEPTYRASLSRHVAEALAPLPTEPLPGAVDALATAKAESRTAAALLTGNYSENAQRKLVHFGIDHLITTEFGAFAEDALDRVGLVQVALDRLAAKGRSIPSLDRVYIIGDTRNDIRCARANGIRSVAVATGKISRAELAREEPTLLLESIADFSTNLLDQLEA